MKNWLLLEMINHLVRVRKVLCVVIVLFLDESGWAEHRTRDGYKYYYNKNTEEYSWTRPNTWSGVSQDLSREEIQVSNTSY